MKKVLCIANHLFGNSSGAQSLARAHIKALYETFGKDNVIVFALVGTECIETSESFVIKKVKKNPIARAINLLIGNTGKIDPIIIKDIINTINLQGVEFLFFDDSIYGNAIRLIKKECNNIQVISFYHDIKRYLAIEWLKKNPKSFPIQLSLVNNEKKTARFADINIVLNEREKKLFTKYYHKDPEMTLPIILSSPNNIRTNNSKKYTILFVGSYYYPNVDGFRWFVNRVVPLINIDYEIVLVGNNMDLIKDEFKDNSRIHVLGRVDDLSLYYERATIVIGPIFEGAGMKVKTAEALSYGKVFAGTNESLLGYRELAGSLLGKSIFVCNNEREFADAINNLKFNDGFCQENYDFFLQNYSIEAAVNKFKSFLE